MNYIKILLIFSIDNLLRFYALKFAPRGNLKQLPTLKTSQLHLVPFWYLIPFLKLDYTVACAKVPSHSLIRILISKRN